MWLLKLAVNTAFFLFLFHQFVRAGLIYELISLPLFIITAFHLFIVFGLTFDLLVHESETE